MSSCQDDTYQRLIRARAFIDDCYDLPLDLEQIASQASFSRYHFLRLFRGAFDQTPHQYLTQRRIAKAKELLGWEPRFTRAEGLERTLAYFKQHIKTAELEPIAF